MGENKAIGVKTDVSKEEQVKHLVDTAVHTFGNIKFIHHFLCAFCGSDIYIYKLIIIIILGKLNIMFNNAGIMHPEDDSALTTDEHIWLVKISLIIKMITKY